MAMPDERAYWRGMALTGLGAIILSPDAMLFRLLEGGFWTSAFWRLLLMGLAVAALSIVWRRGALMGDLRALGWALPATAACIAVSNLGFVYAVEHTSVADTLAIIATAPVFAAGFAILIGERPPLRTWIAAGVIAVGLAVILDAGFSAETWKGNLAALVVAVAVGVWFTIGRAKAPIPLTPALALSCFVAAGISAGMADTLAPPAGDWPWLLLLGLVVLPVSLTLITLGPRTLPAAEVGLLMLLETAIGPIWAWFVLQEAPSAATWTGGGLIVGALAAHSLAAREAHRRRRGRGRGRRAP